MLFASCGNGDNALEEIINGGGSGGSGEVTAATITTAPTATAGDILDGSTTELVTAGVADGGTVMYKATSDTDPKPTSTDGFSAEIPTAAGLAVGTYFVWYYAKAADAQHSDSEIAATPVKVSVQPSLCTPLTIEAITAGTITVSGAPGSMKFSTDGGVTKKAIQASIDVAAGDKVAFYGTASCYDGTKIGGADDGFKCKVYGNIMSLLHEDFATNYSTLTDAYTFYELFENNTTLTDASGLLLPAMTLTDDCYEYMFKDCTALTTAPAELPAKTLAVECYRNMFYGCIALTTAPELKGETLYNKCYYYMFAGCTSLTTAYVKAAYITANNECTYMFDGCTAAGAVLHTTTANKGSWSSGVPGNWTVADDWN